MWEDGTEASQRAARQAGASTADTAGRQVARACPLELRQPESVLDCVHVSDKIQKKREVNCPTMKELIDYAELRCGRVKRGAEKLEEALGMTKAMLDQSWFREKRERNIKAIVSILIMRPRGGTVCGSTTYPRLFDHLRVSPFHDDNVPGKDEFGKLIEAFMQQHHESILQPIVKGEASADEWRQRVALLSHGFQAGNEAIDAWTLAYLLAWNYNGFAVDQIDGVDVPQFGAPSEDGRFFFDADALSDMWDGQAENAPSFGVALPKHTIHHLPLVTGGVCKTPHSEVLLSTLHVFRAETGSDNHTARYRKVVQPTFALRAKLGIRALQQMGVHMPRPLGEMERLAAHLFLRPQKDSKKPQAPLYRGGSDAVVVKQMSNGLRSGGGKWCNGASGASSSGVHETEAVTSASDDEFAAELEAGIEAESSGPSTNCVDGEKGAASDSEVRALPT